MTRLLGGLAFVVAIVHSALAVAQPQFPSRRVELIVPFAAGGAVDIVARALGESLAGSWPAGVEIVNRPGENGALGKNLVLNAAPDGTTLAIISGNETNVALARGLTPIAILVRGSGERVPSAYWQALVGPPAMDERLVQRINHDALLALTNVREKMRGFGLNVVGSSSNDFARYVAAGGGPLPAAAPLQAAEAPPPWLKVVEAKSGGYVVGGTLHGSMWGFRLPGRAIKQAGGSGPMILMVDGVIFQFNPVTPEAYGRSAPDPVKAQIKYEQEYLAKAMPGVQITQQEMCKAAPLPHGSWMAEIPARIVDSGSSNLREVQRTPHQAYISFQVADVVLMTTVAYGDDTANAAAEKIDSLCRTFFRDRP